MSDQITAYFTALKQALAGAKLKTSSGAMREADVSEFMFMGVNQGCASFKHSDSRNYLYLLPTGELYVPESNEPFHRGTFDY